jgi:hypothetical protein
MTENNWHRATRPEELMARFPAMAAERPMSPGFSTQVLAIDRAERIVAAVWRWTWEGQESNDPANVLFDPARVPALAARADEAAAEYHSRTDQDGDLHFDTGDGLDGDYDPHDPAEQGVVRIWRVGSRGVHIARDRWRDSPNRLHDTTDYFVHLYEFLTEQLDYHDCTELGCDRNCDLACTVNIAKACDGPTRLLPVNRGTLVLLFRCCRVCEELAGQIAANTYRTNAKIAELEVSEDWPPSDISPKG